MTRTVPTTVSVSWTLSRPDKTVWQLTLNNPPENRLLPAVLEELMGHLTTIEGEWRLANCDGPGLKKIMDRQGGAVILDSANPKFWSNGFDPSTLTSPDFRGNVFDPLKARLLTFPLVTIAAVHGHCFAGGMILALCCDYRLVTSGRGLWSLNEAVIGIPIVAATAAIVRAKLSPNATRDAVSGKRFNQGDLLRLGVVEEIVEPEKLISRAVEIGKVEGDRARGGSLGSIKDSIYADAIIAASVRRQAFYPDVEEQAFWDRVARENAAQARNKGRL